jgi:hypothetical protein
VWFSAEQPEASTLLTLLAAYNTGFALIYAACLYMVSRCHRQAEDLKIKVRERNVTEEDMRAWGGFTPSVTNWIAGARHTRRYYFMFGGWLGFVADCFTTWFCL